MFYRVLFIGLFMFASASAQASLISIDGNLDHKLDVAYIEFNVSQPSSVDFWTDSHSPGFDPILSLFDNLGNLIAFNDDYGFGSNSGGFHTGQNVFDSSLFVSSLLGNYTLAASIWPNHANGNYTLENAFPTNIGTAISGAYSYYNVNLQGDNLALGHVASVPGPTPISLMILGLAGLGIIKKQKASA